MEYFIGGAVVLIVVLILKARVARTTMRNADPLQEKLLNALAATIEGRLSEDGLDEVIRQVGTDAEYSTHRVSGDSLHTRLAHAASMAPMVYSEKQMVDEIRKLAQRKSIEL